MKIVIDIPDEQYSNLKNNKWFGQDIRFCGESFASYIKCGTPLPKGHGDLIDKKEITAFRELECNGHDVESLDEFTVIIEADTESEDINNLCNQCSNKRCIFQSGIVRSHCDFYKAESEDEK